MDAHRLDAAAGKAVKKGKAGKTAAATPDSPHPFDWDPADDCETSLEAYKDIAPLLTKLAQKLNKTKAELRIYDPYYCQGGPAKHLAKLGFTNVHNANEDFYARLDAGKVRWPSPRRLIHTASDSTNRPTRQTPADDARLAANSCRRTTC